MKDLMYQQKVLCCIMDAVIGMKGSPNEVKWATRLIHTQARMCTEAEGGHFEHLQ